MSGRTVHADAARCLVLAMCCVHKHSDHTYIPATPNKATEMSS